MQRQEDKSRHAFKNNVFNYLDQYDLADNVMKDLNDLASTGNNRGLREIIDIGKKVHNGDQQEHIGIASTNLLLKIKELELKRYSQGLRKLKELSYYILWKLYQKSMSRWGNNIRRLRYE